MRTGPFTFNRLSFAPRMRSAHTFSRFFTLRDVSVMRMRCICCVDSSVFAAGALYGAAAAADIFLRVQKSRPTSVIILPLDSHRARALRPIARVVVVPSIHPPRVLGLSPRSHLAPPPLARASPASPRASSSSSRSHLSRSRALGPSRRSASVDLVTETDARAVARARVGRASRITPRAAPISRRSIARRSRRSTVEGSIFAIEP